MTDTPLSGASPLPHLNCGEISQQALCAVFLAHPLLALVLEQEGEEDATDFILAALVWIESPAFQADYVAASQALVPSQD